ncbi:CBS domain-containing protein [Paenibacillus thalictri]|uniref:GGDEF domain-containing protein n=1 Tax=Paenibacillus thalictri TaxID=2527873 RepID=A0A4V2J3Q5_9BACL|nr:GGDEF domain-containing protein [Paenibacillus thalictri]TBL74672.1 GGDEF domain-containing protein [Paenibacillus thalictri]
MKVEQVMSDKVCSITSGKSVRHAADLMNELRIGSLVVVDEGEVIGIITSKDIRSAHPNRIVADAMTHNPISIPKSMFIGSALHTMEQNNVERLIVQDGRTVEGIVTRETLKSTISNYIDPLTHLYRSKYIEYIHEYLVGEGNPFHLLFIDLNDFGIVNKKYGHAIGDDLLIHYANLLREVSEEQDYVCRYGGDEFVMITRRSHEDIQPIIERLSTPVTFQSFTFSAAVGVIYGYDDSGQAYSYRDCISTASLNSTNVKQKRLTS